MPIPIPNRRNTVLVAILILAVLISGIVIGISNLSLNPSTVSPKNISTAHTINGNQTFGNTSIDENATWLEEGERSQNRLIHVGIISILFMQMIILVLIIRCGKHRTYILKPVSR